MANPITSVLNRVLRRGYGHLPPPSRRIVADLSAAAQEETTYRRLRDRGFRPDGIIDVGAFTGNWTRMTQQVFGAVPALMVEAQEAKRATLEALVRERPGLHLHLGPLAARAGETVTFYEMETGSSFLPEVSDAPRVAHELVTSTLDTVAAQALPAGDHLFLKIDVQGAELHVLGGGAATLARCALVQLETALLQYNAGAPLLPEVVAYMAERDFLPIEVSGFSRPRDVLVQIDLLFARRDSTLLRPDRFGF